jgi:hypothetical protein
MTNSTKIYGDMSLSLKKKVEKHLDFIGLDISENLDIYFDTVKKESNAKSLSVLILNEPAAVKPENYRKSSFKKFDLVIILSPWRANKLQIPEFAYSPVEIPKISNNSIFNRINGIVMINDHKFSATDSSLYGFRRKALIALQEKKLPISLYGPNWQMGRSMEFRKRVAAFRRGLKNLRIFKISEAFSEIFESYSCYQGHSEDKQDTLSSFRFALVIENDMESLSEKLFDAIFAGCIVFYLGPNLKSLELLERCFIKLPNEIPTAIKVIQENLISPPWQILDNMKDFLSNSLAMDFVSEDSVARSIATLIKKHADSAE